MIDEKYLLNKLAKKFNNLLEECKVIENEVNKFMEKYYDGVVPAVDNYNYFVNKVVKKASEGKIDECYKEFYVLVSTLVSLYTYAKYYELNLGDIVITRNAFGVSIRFVRILDKDKIEEIVKKGSEEVRRRKKALRKCQKLLNILKMVVSSYGWVYV